MSIVAPLGRNGRLAFDRLVYRDYVTRHTFGRGIDHLSVQSGGALSLLLGFPKHFDDAASASNLLRRRREDVVGQADLRGMDRPFSLDTERCCAARSGEKAFRVRDVPKRTIDCADTLRTAR